MKIFFGSIFIKKENLKEVGINYPIKLEYYKLINEEVVLNESQARYGINVVKTEYIGEKVKVENKIIKYLSDNEKRVEEILEKFKEYEVTPNNVQEIISDYSRKLALI